MYGHAHWIQNRIVSTAAQTNDIISILVIPNMYFNVFMLFIISCLLLVIVNILPHAMLIEKTTKLLLHSKVAKFLLLNDRS